MSPSGQGSAVRRVSRTTLIAAVAVLIVLAGSALWQFVPSDRSDDVPLTVADERITVDVRNAGGIDGMARIATDHLRSEGFDVVSLGNATNFGEDSTMVIDRVGEPERAAAVARALGVRRIASLPDPDLYVDVTVQLGPEWHVPPETQVPPERMRLRAWLRALGGGGDTNR